MNFKKLYLIPVFAGSLFSLSACGGTQTYHVPTFDEGKQIDLIAYAPSCPSRILTGSNPSTITEENYKNIAKAGFTHTLSLYEGFFTNELTLEDTLKKSYQTANEQSLQILDYCQKYGMKHYVRDWAAYNMGIYNGYDNPLSKFRDQVDSYEEYEEYFDILFPEETPGERQYFRHPAYAGNYLTDEPFISDMKTLGEITNLYLERMNELGIENVRPILNLLPCHAGGGSLGSGWEQYVDTYYAYAGKKVNSISYDFYPFMRGKKDTSYMKDLYLYNFQLAAEKALDYGCELQSYVQTKGDATGMRDLSCVGDIRMQLYTCLAFGSSAVTYYEYGCKNGEEDGDYALLNLTTGELTKNYDYVKVVNNEIKSFEKIISCFRYDNIICRLGDPDVPNLNFDLLNDDRGSVTSNGRVAITNCTEDCFLTSLKRKTDNSDAFMLVNFTDPFYQLSNTVTLKFSNTKAIMIYKLGERQILQSNDGVYTFDLEPGEGTFIVPLN